MGGKHFSKWKRGFEALIEVNSKLKFQGWGREGATDFFSQKFFFKNSLCQIPLHCPLEKSGYKLNALLYRNPVSGKGQVALLSFIADESAASYRFALGSFDYLKNSNPAVIIIDKVSIKYNKTSFNFSQRIYSCECPSLNIWV